MGSIAKTYMPNRGLEFFPKSSQKISVNEICVVDSLLHYKLHNMRIFTFISIILGLVSGAVFGFGLSFREDGGVDVTVIAVVGDRTILSTELDHVVLASGYEIPEDSTEFYSLYGRILSDLLNEELIYQAALDESLEIDDQMIETEFTSRWDSLVARFGGETALQDTLEKEGLSIPEFKYKVKEQVRIGLLKQLYIQWHIGYVEVSDEDIRDYLESNRDSIGNYPAQVHLFAILISPPSDSICFESARNRADSAYSLLEKGREFVEIAQMLSDDDRTCSTGGKIGKFKGDDLPEAFVQAIDGLSPGEHSKPVSGGEGYHIIQVISRDGDNVELAHLFFEPSPAMELARETADDVYNLAVTDADFAELVIEYSSDSATIEKSGEVGWFPLSVVLQTMALVDTALAMQLLQDDSSNEAAIEGKILPPMPELNGWAIYKIAEFQPSEEISIEKHRDFLREIARREKFIERLKRMLGKLKEQIYVDIRDKRLAPYVQD